jgi:hypothetical protein
VSTNTFPQIVLTVSRVLCTDVVASQYVLLF